ncbi:MAG: hypothetical protein SGJ05_03625, partial [bacterium]|nr:hypothetical protein [bacterium]
MNKRLALVIGFSLCAMSLPAQTEIATPEPSKLFIHGGIFGSANLHNASFTQLPGVPECCVTYGSRLGFGGALVIGMEYDPTYSLVGLPMRAGASLSYSLLTGALHETEFVGNIIRGQDVARGLTEHRIAANYGIVAIEPYVALGFPFVKGLHMKLGMIAGIPLSKSYEQSELLLQPDGVDWTFENGSRTRGSIAGPLPSTEPLYLAGLFGVRYELHTSRLLSVTPEIQYQHAFTSVVRN